MATEDPTNASLLMDRGLPLGNSLDTVGRRALHVKVRNLVSEPIPVDVEGSSGLATTGLQDSIALIANTPVEVKVGATKLTGRKLATIQPTNGSIFFGFNSLVTTTTGTEIFKSQTAAFDVTDTGEVWIVSSAARTVKITEGA